jgi:hypothetical protein
MCAPGASARAILSSSWSQLSIYLDPEIFNSLEAFAKRQGKAFSRALVVGGEGNPDVAVVK